jgi:hypothetical protein
MAQRLFWVAQGADKEDNAYVDKTLLEHLGSWCIMTDNVVRNVGESHP